MAGRPVTLSRGWSRQSGGLTSRSPPFEKLSEVGFERRCDPHNRIERRVRFRALDFTDQRLADPGALGQIPLAHLQRKSLLSDVAAESFPEMGAGDDQGVGFGHLVPP